jgi:hypothetical protein
MRLPAVLDPRDLAALLPRLLRAAGDVERLLVEVQALIVRIENTRTAAADVIARVDGTAARVEELVQRFEPPLQRLLPVLERVTDTVTPEQVDVLAEKVPELAETLQTEALPMLRSMSSVAPDLHDLLDASLALNELLGQLPGMGRVKKKAEEARAEEEAADEADDTAVPAQASGDRD